MAISGREKSFVSMKCVLALLFLASAALTGCERQDSSAAQPSRTPVVTRTSVPLRFFLFGRWEKPRFQDGDAKEYLSEYDSFLDQFKDAYRALKGGNVTGFQRLFGSAEVLQTKATQLGSRLNADDQRRLKKYLQTRAVELYQSGLVSGLQ
jgi:hypothetical protein